MDWPTDAQIDQAAETLTGSPWEKYRVDITCVIEH
jgi:hypothetical protein